MDDKEFDTSEIIGALAHVSKTYAHLLGATDELRIADRRHNAATCEHSNAISALADAVARMPKPGLTELCRELDRAIPKADRPHDFVVKENET